MCKSCSTCTTCLQPSYQPFGIDTILQMRKAQKVKYLAQKLPASEQPWKLELNSGSLSPEYELYAAVLLILQQNRHQHEHLWVIRQYFTKGSLFPHQHDQGCQFSIQIARLRLSLRVKLGIYILNQKCRRLSQNLKDNVLKTKTIQ